MNIGMYKLHSTDEQVPLQDIFQRRFNMTVYGRSARGSQKHIQTNFR